MNWSVSGIEQSLTLEGQPYFGQTIEKYKGEKPYKVPNKIQQINNTELSSNIEYDNEIYVSKETSALLPSVGVNTHMLDGVIICIEAE